MTSTVQPVLNPQPVPPANEGHVTALSADERLLRKAVDRCLKAQLCEVLERLEGGVVEKGAKDEEDGRWVTMHGQPVFIREGQTAAEAAAERFGGKEGGGKDETSSGADVYHGTAEHYAKSILKDGLVSGTGSENLNFSESVKGRVYVSTEQGEAFAFAVEATTNEFQRGVKEGKYSTADSKKLQVLMIVAAKDTFPESEYKGKENTQFRSNKPVPASAFRRVETYRYKDAVEFSDRWMDARRTKQPAPTMPPPRPVKVLSSGQKSGGTELYLCVGIKEKEGQTKSLKSQSPASAVPTNLTKWDQAVMREVRPIWFGLFKKGGDRALKEIRRFPRHARKMAVLSKGMVEESERVEVKGGEGSGNFGHEGRPGEVGGSGPGGGGGEGHVTPEQNSQYLDAIEQGDMGIAQRIVREVARGAGYNIGPVWHGTNVDFNEYKEWSHFGENRGQAESRLATIGKTESSHYNEVFLKLENPISMPDLGTWDYYGMVDIARERGWTDLKGNEFKNAVEKAREKYGVVHGRESESPRYKEYLVDTERTYTRLTDQIHREVERHGDGIVYENKVERSGKAYIVFDPFRVKSSSPITRDDSGDVIPLSMRFNKKEKDVRKSLKAARPSIVIPDWKGGPGSGHFGHEGRPGEVGGSMGSVGAGGFPRPSVITVYHGTSASLLKKIKNEGIHSELHDGSEPGRATWISSDFGLAAQYTAGEDSIIFKARVSASLVEGGTGRGGAKITGGVPPEKLMGYATHIDGMGYGENGWEWHDMDGNSAKKSIEDLVVYVPIIIKSETKSLKSTPSIVIPEWIEDPDVLDALEREMFKFAQGIDQTTADTLRDELMAGMEDGETISQLANRISGLSDEWVEGWRSEMIARTETARAFTTGHIEAWRSTGVVSRKVWVAAGDACPFCQQMDGTVVELGESFFDQGEEQTADWRGQEIAMGHDYSDINGPPLHPNCRCVLVAELDEEKMFVRKGGEEEGGRWVTMHGSPVFIRDGQSAEDAAKERFGGDKEEQAKPSKEMIDRASKVFTSIQDVSTSVGKAADNQMRGGVLSEKTGVFKEFTEKSKVANLGKIVNGLNELKEQDSEGFETARQWDLADRFGVKNYKDIPDEVTVWRGHEEEESLGKFTNVSHKKEIADKFGESGVVTEFRIKKDDIVFALSNSVFDEGELIVRGKSLQQVGRTVSEAASERMAFREWSSSMKVGAEIKTTDGRVGTLVDTGIGTSLIVKFPEGTDYLFKFSRVKR
jgi:hypothetical protein